MKEMIRKIPKKYLKLGILLSLIIVLSLTILYIIVVTPSRYVFNEHTITSDKIPTSFDQVKIAFLSDLDIHEEADIVRLEKIVDSLNQNHVDIVVFGGDLFDSQIINEEKVMATLSLIKAPYGKFAITGEKEFIDIHKTISILESSGFEVLRNQARKIYVNHSYITFIGLENSDDVSSLLTDSMNDTFNMVFVHQPDYFDGIKDQNVDIQVSGHSHGGYIRLPFLDGLIKKEGAKNYQYGSLSENDVSLYISNGLGMESDQLLRIGTTPDILIFTLSSTVNSPNNNGSYMLPERAEDTTNENE